MSIPPAAGRVKSAYRSLLQVARGLPHSEREKILPQIRDAFKSKSAETDPGVINELLTKAASSLGYLKIITPKTARRSNQSGVTKLVFPSSSSQGSTHDGKKAMSNWTGKNLDPDSVKRHYQGLKRAGFRSNSDVKGPLF